MFVIVKQESFATVSVGILKLLLPVFITGIQSEGGKTFEVDLFYSDVKNIFYYYSCCECSVFESRDFTGTLCCLCCSAKAC